MSCLGNCGNCNCDKIDVCQDTTKRKETLDSKLKVLKDYSCLLAQTTCVNLPKRVGQFAYYLWCMMRDYAVLISNLEQRVDNLCSVVKCQDKRINQIIDYLNSTLQNEVSFAMKSGGSSDTYGGGTTYTKIDTSKDGSFTLHWNMIDNGEVGKGTIKGKVNHSYRQNKDGSITANIESFTLKSATYTLSGGSTNSAVGASFSVADSKGSVVWSKNYHPRNAWSETINKTVPVGQTFSIAPKGGTSQDIPILRTIDKWVFAPTFGNISANYTNNNPGVVFVSDPCPSKCNSCDYKED